MGIYIKGMEMPTEDKEIIVRISSDGTVMTEYASPIPWAKAVPVPEHGRLIDADALTKVSSPRYGLVNVGQIDNAPTIIPASEDGAKAEEDTEPWLCLSCRHYPPSSTDGKPCSQCNPSEVWHSCYDPAEEGE